MAYAPPKGNPLKSTLSSAMDSEAVVYVVDDDPSVRKSLCWLLESANYTTQAFASAQEFLDKFQPKKPSCLVLDVRMPGSSGLQLQTQLDTQNITIPIIFISGHVDVRTASVAFRAGACDVLTKPVDVDLLLARVNEAITKDREHRRQEIERAVKLDQLDKLTPKELQVFCELFKGRTIKQLANHFNITFQTAAKHRARVLDKLHFETDAQLIHAYTDVDIGHAVKK